MRTRESATRGGGAKPAERQTHQAVQQPQRGGAKPLPWLQISRGPKRPMHAASGGAIDALLRESSDFSGPLERRRRLLVAQIEARRVVHAAAKRANEKAKAAAAVQEAAAAVQEHVGRQGQFPDGISIVTVADYFTLSVRRHASLPFSFVTARCLFAGLSVYLVSHQSLNEET